MKTLLKYFHAWGIDLSVIFQHVRECVCVYVCFGFGFAKAKIECVLRFQWKLYAVFRPVNTLLLNTIQTQYAFWIRSSVARSLLSFHQHFVFLFSLSLFPFLHSYHSMEYWIIIYFFDDDGNFGIVNIVFSHIFHSSCKSSKSFQSI